MLDYKKRDFIGCSIGISTCNLRRWNGHVMGCGVLGVDGKLFGRERERERE